MSLPDVNFELDRMVRRKTENFDQFRSDQDTVWSAVSGASFTIRATIEMASRFGCHAGIDGHRVMMWYTVLDYQMESFFLILDRKLGEGVALLRMATELARDIVRIGTNDQKLHLWLRRGTDRKKQNDYRRTFRFDDSDVVERYVRNIYELSSSIGIHGHFLTSANMVPTKWSTDREFVSLAVPDLAVYETLELWLNSFFPLHDLCVRGFDWSEPEEMRVARSGYDEMHGAFDHFLEGYRIGIQELKRDSSSSVQ